MALRVTHLGLLESFGRSIPTLFDKSRKAKRRPARTSRAEPVRQNCQVGCRQIDRDIGRTFARAGPVLVRPRDMGGPRPRLAAAARSELA